MVADRASFEKTEHLKALRVPIKLLSDVRNHSDATKFVFARRGRKSIVSCEEDPKSFRLVLLKADPPADLLAFPDVSLRDFEIKTGYDDFTTDEILRKLMNCDCDPPSSFETIGYVSTPISWYFI